MDRHELLERKYGAKHEYAAELGYFTLAFSDAEGALNSAIWVLLGVPQRIGGEDVTAAVRDIGQRISLFARLAKSRPLQRELRADAKKIAAALNFINEHRNTLVHGFHLVNIKPDMAGMTHVRADREQLTRKLRGYSVKFLSELTDYAALTQDALRCLYVNVRDGRREHTPPSLDTQPQPPVLKVKIPPQEPGPDIPPRSSRG